MRGRLQASLDLLLPGGLWLAALVVSRAAGFRMVIPWGYYQLLDRQMLATHPLGSLCYLHSQPPGLDALLVATLRAAELFGTTPEVVGTVVFQALGLAAAIALFRLILVTSGSRGFATAGVVAALADPGYHVFANLFFYEFPVYVLLLLLLATGMRYLRGGDVSSLVFVVLFAAAITLTRSLFHPIWALGLCVLLVLLREPRPSWSRHAALAVGLLLVVLVPWPLKNRVVFGQATYASMSAYNLARGIPGCLPAVAPSAGDAIVMRAQSICGEPALPTLAATTKSDGSANWNHVGWLLRADALSRCGIAWRLGHPGEWLATAVGNYAMWTRASFVHPYGRQLLGPPTPAYLAYAGWYNDVLFFDLRPAIERLLPGLFLHRYAMMRGSPVPYTVFGFVVFPLVVGLLVSRLRQAPAAVLLLYCTLWPMLVVCLTDGQEGNRMRFSTSALFVVMLALVVAALRRPNRRFDAPP